MFSSSSKLFFWICVMKAELGKNKKTDNQVLQQATADFSREE